MTESLTILDGGMGSELAKRGLGASDGIWSAKALLEVPDLVAEVHRDFIKSGARVIITNSYSTIPSYLEKENMAGRYLELTELAGRIARQVVDESDQQVLVAGSLPPLDVSYRADLVPEDTEAQPIYANLVTALEPHVDLFLCETMSSAREARNAIASARSIIGGDKPVWVSWTLADNGDRGLRSGETVAEAYELVTPFSPDAFLFNCTDPQAITFGLSELLEMTDKPVGAYPNSFHVPEGWTLDNEVSLDRREMSPEEFLRVATKWEAMGALIIGGCCGIGPDHISLLASSH